MASRDAGIFFIIMYLLCNDGPSPSGKAQDFDSCISLVRIQLAQIGACSSVGRALDF